MQEGLLYHPTDPRSALR